MRMFFLCSPLYKQLNLLLFHFIQYFIVSVCWSSWRWTEMTFMRRQLLSRIKRKSVYKSLWIRAFAKWPKCKCNVTVQHQQTSLFPLPGLALNLVSSDGPLKFMRPERALHITGGGIYQPSYVGQVSTDCPGCTADSSAFCWMSKRHVGRSRTVNAGCITFSCLPYYWWWLD